MSSPILTKLSLTFSILSLIIIAIIAIVLLSHARIIITPEVKQTTQSFPIIISENTETSSAQLTGILWERDENGEQIFSVLETTKKESKLARGEITIVNDRSSDQTLVAGTRFLTSQDVLYRLDRQVVIPKKNHIKAFITADKPGISGDRKEQNPPERLLLPALSSSLKQLVYGLIESPITGGVTHVGTLTQEDVNQAKQELNATLLERAKIDYLASYFEEQTSFEITEAPELITEIRITSEHTDQDIGALISKFTLTLSSHVSGVAVDRTTLVKTIQSKFIQLLPKGEMFVSINPDKLEYSLSEFDRQNNSATIEVIATGESIITPDAQVVLHSDIRGKTKDDLTAYFEQVPGVSTVDLSFSPFWVKKVPRFKSQTKIEIKEVN